MLLDVSLAAQLRVVGVEVTIKLSFISIKNHPLIKYHYYVIF